VVASDLREPGAFRRHFLHSKAKKEGRVANLLTRNFIDFLALYGLYGGDVVPSDDEGDDDDDDDFSDFEYQPSPGALAASSRLTGTESTPLLGDEERPSQRHSRTRTSSNVPVHGISSKKAFFMVMKAFVGTGVLFLPRAFLNGGLAFSIVVLIAMGWLTLHCMMLLVETSRTLGGSFGELGEKVYGPWMRYLILASIALAQVFKFPLLSFFY
jgi:solute carrier family 36 (proton-coupled amino acid transporter)